MVERSFLESIDDALAEKASLQSQLPEVICSLKNRDCWRSHLPDRWVRFGHISQSGPREAVIEYYFLVVLFWEFA